MFEARLKLTPIPFRCPVARHMSPSKLELELTCVREDRMIAAVIGEAHPSAQCKLLQFGQRLFVLDGALMFDSKLLGAALVMWRDLVNGHTRGA